MCARMRRTIGHMLDDLGVTGRPLWGLTSIGRPQRTHAIDTVSLFHSELTIVNTCRADCKERGVLKKW